MKAKHCHSRPRFKHSRAGCGGNPIWQALRLDSRLRGNDSACFSCHLIFIFILQQSQLDAPEPQGVDDDRYGAETHRRAGDYRAEQNTEEGIQHPGGYRNTERIVDKGEEEVLADIPHRHLREPPRLGDAAQIADRKSVV